MAQYLPLLVMLILAGLFAGLSFLASSLLGQRRRPTAAKVAPYECGIVPTSEPLTACEKAALVLTAARRRKKGITTREPRLK